MKPTKIIPKYAVLPLIAVFVFNMIAYYGGFVFAKDAYHYNISVALDGKIPLVEFFIIFYFLAYLQWVISYIFIARESAEVCYRYATAVSISKIFCLILFLAFPTTLVRPAPGEGLFGSIVSFLYTVDEPTNLLPSIHCLESWVCFRASLSMKKLPSWYKIITLFFSVAVFLSTVFVKQHVVLDIPAGILVFEAGLLIVKLTGIDSKLRSVFTRRT